MTSSPALAPAPSAGIHMHQLPIAGVLADCVRALIAVDVERAGPLPLAIAPHDALMLSVDFGRGADRADEKAQLGHNTRLTGIRQWTGSFVGAGNCTSMFALLTPLGAVRLLDCRRLQHAPRIRAGVAELLDGRITRELKEAIARADTAQAKLWALGAWLEARAAAQRRASRAALRAGRAAMRLCAEPSAAIEHIAGEQHVSRRQLERDFELWLGATPKHVAQVARVQQVSRQARAGTSLADASAHAGFSDQSHMTLVVKRLTGLTPRRFVASQRTPIAAAFRAATGGGTVYL